MMIVTVTNIISAVLTMLMVMNGHDNDDGNAADDGDGNDSDDKITFAGATKHPGSSHWC